MHPEWQDVMAGAPRVDWEVGPVSGLSFNVGRFCDFRRET